MLTGRMMDFPLTLTHVLERSRTYFGRSEIVSRQPDKSLQRATYADFHGRACQLAHALTRLGVKPGDRVASLCWNHQRHLELYFAVPAMGAVLHTLNLRLHRERPGLHRPARRGPRHRRGPLAPAPAREVPRPGAERAARHRHPGRRRPRPRGPPRLRGAARARARRPSTSPRSTRTPRRCSATPRAPPATRRACSTATAPSVLHTLGQCMTDTLGASESDTVLPVVPMFHAAAWGLPFSAVFAGAQAGVPGPAPGSPVRAGAHRGRARHGGRRACPPSGSASSRCSTVSRSAGTSSAMRAMVIGGSAAPPAMIEGFLQRHGLRSRTPGA